MLLDLQTAAARRLFSSAHDAMSDPPWSRHNHFGRHRSVGVRSNSAYRAGLPDVSPPEDCYLGSRERPWVRGKAALTDAERVAWPARNNLEHLLLTLDTSTIMGVPRCRGVTLDAIGW